MADGRFVMSPADARDKAEQMIAMGRQLGDLFDTVTKKIQEIDNTSTGTYQGDRKPAELRAQLESFRGTFERAVDQIIKSATDIKVMATVKENE